MKSNAYKLIDELVNIIDDSKELANKQSSINRLESEKQEITKSLKELKDGISDEKYIDMNREMADRNIEINTSKDIKKTTKKLNELEENRQAIKHKMDSTSNELKNMQIDYEKRNEYCKSIKEELISLDKNFYDEEMNALNILNKDIEKQQQQFNALIKEYECLSIAIDDLTTDIKNKQNQLNQIRINLKNGQSYFDSDLQAIDLKEIENYNKKIESINNQIHELLENPVILGHSIKEMIKNDDIYGALKKTKELSEMISKIIENYKSVNYEEYSNELKLLKEKMASIDYGIITPNKDYVTQREEFLNNIIEELEKDKKYLDDKLNCKSEKMAKKILKTIQSLTFEENDLNNMINKYNDMEITEEKIQSQLEVSNECIKQNLDNIRKVTNNYRQDLNMILKNNNNYKEQINAIDNEIIEYKKELEQIIKSNDKKIIYNIEEIIANSKRIKELQEILEQKKEYIENDKSPIELYDQIEMVLGSLNLSDIKSIPKKSISFEKVNIEKTDRPGKAKITSSMHKVIDIINELDDKNGEYVDLDEIVSTGGSVWN